MSVEQNLELGGLKRQTGNGVHWTRGAHLRNISRGFESGSTAQRIISRAANSQMVAVARALSGDRTGIAAR